jgi:hypothetical protein
VKHPALRAALAVLAVAAAWTAFGLGVIPPIVFRALAGQGPEAVQRLVRWQIEYPDRFTARWPSYTLTLTAVLLACGAILVLSMLPAFRALVERRHGPATGVRPAEALGRGRALVVQTLIAVLLSASLFSTFTNIEIWPFSPYRMYATTQGSTYSLLRLYGIADSARVDLGEVDATPPFDRPRFQSGMRRLLVSRQCDWIGEVAGYGLSTYGRLHPGALGHIGDVRRVELRELTWKLDLHGLSPVPVSDTLVCARPAAGRAPS